MDENKSRERIVSILNNNDCPSFTIRRNDQLPVEKRHPPVERPSLARQANYTGRNSSSFSSSSSSSSSSTTTPPLLRYDSSSSTSSSKSSASMDSTPSPITPAYNYNDGLLPYTDLVGYLPSPSTITPFMEQQMMISASQPGQLMLDYAQKSMPQLAPATAYPLITVQRLEQEPLSVEPRIPSLTSDHSTATSTNSKSSPSMPAASNFLQNNKNKYPCPYVASHNCSATFTTSGHAARHGKKHTGEKGVHCPVCNKAFTRKDNMKQHERTHKHEIAGSATSSLNEANESDAPRKSKAAITKEAAKAKAQKLATTTTASDQTTHAALSPLSMGIPLEPMRIDQSTSHVEPVYPSHPTLLPLQSPSLPLDETLLHLQPQHPSTSLYPPLSESLINIHSHNDPNNTATLPTLQSQPQHAQMQEVSLAASIPQMPRLIRGFSDLDTLAQAAAQEYPPNSYYGGM